MKIITYHSPDAPEHHRWLARFQSGKGFMPVFCTAATEDAVIAKAQAFWDAETAKAQGRMVGKHHRPQATEDRIVETVGQPDPVEKGDAPLPDDVPDDCATCEGAGLVEGLDTIGGTATYETCPDCVRPLLATAQTDAVGTADTTDDLDDLLG